MHPVSDRAQIAFQSPLTFSIAPCRVTITSAHGRYWPSTLQLHCRHSTGTAASIQWLLLSRHQPLLYSCAVPPLLLLKYLARTQSLNFAHAPWNPPSTSLSAISSSPSTSRTRIPMSTSLPAANLQQQAIYPAHKGHSSTKKPLYHQNTQ